MSFGFQVRTQKGLRDITDARVLRLAGIVTRTGKNNRYPPPAGWTRSRGRVFVKGATSDFMLYSWDGDTLVSEYYFNNDITVTVFFFYYESTYEPNESYGGWFKKPNGIVVLSGTMFAANVVRTGTSTYYTSTGNSNPYHTRYFHRIECDVDEIIFFRLRVDDWGAVTGHSTSLGAVCSNQQSLPYVVVKFGEAVNSGHTHGMRIWTEDRKLIYDAGSSLLSVSGINEQPSAEDNYFTYMMGIAYYPIGAGQQQAAKDEFYLQRTSATQVRTMNIPSGIAAAPPANYSNPTGFMCAEF